MVNNIAPEVISSGNEANLTFVYDTSGIVGPVVRHIAVTFHEPRAPVLMIRLQGIARRWAESVPQSVHFGDILAGESASQALNFIINDSQELDLENCDASNPWVKLIRRSSKVDGSAEGEIVAEVPRVSTAGPFTGKVILQSRGVPPRSLEVPYDGNIVLPFAVSPKQLFYGYVTQGSRASLTATIMLSSLSKGKFDDVRIQTDLGSEFVISKERTSDPLACRLELVFTPTGAPGIRAGKVEIALGDIIAAIPVQAFVRGVGP